MASTAPVKENYMEAARVNRTARLSKSFYQGLRYLAVIVLTFFYLGPWIWLLSTSLKTNANIFKVPPSLIPIPVMWSNYIEAINYIPFFTYLVNTLVICGLVVLGRLFSCSLVAYGFSIVRWRGRDTMFIIVLATMMLPFQVTMIPLYIIFRQLDWINTILPLVVPAFFGSAFFIFLLRQFFLGIPRELIEAAVIDGANHLNIYWRIVLPLAKPALITLVIFTFLWTYTDFQGPLIYLTSPELWTLSLGLRGFTSAHGSMWNLLMAASFLFTLPVVIMFFFSQRAFIEGITTTGLK